MPNRNSDHEDPENGGRGRENGSPQGVNVRSKDYFIALTVGPCTFCGVSTPLLALVLPPSHETLSPAEDDEDGALPEAWDRVPWSAFLFYVEYLPDGVQQRVQASSERYRPAVSEASQRSYWANHCQHCGSLQDDHDLFCEPEGAFFPVDAASASAIELTCIDEPFAAAAAGYACQPEYLEHLLRT
jgi:hypothetical protein